MMLMMSVTAFAQAEDTKVILQSGANTTIYDGTNISTAIGAAKKGNKNMLGKKHSAESKKKMSEAKKGMHWYNNGQINKFCYECPDGFTPGKLR